MDERWRWTNSKLLALRALWFLFRIYLSGRAMDEGYRVVTDLREIARLNKVFGKRLAKLFRHRENREIGYPHGRFEGKVYFEFEDGGDVLGWSQHQSRYQLSNFIVRGEPGNDKYVVIAAQLNFPRGKYKRSLGGAFVCDS